MKKNVYDVNEYTDREIYNILDLTNPSECILEAKIIQMIHRYDRIQNTDGHKLQQFFIDVYNRFFYEPDILEDNCTPDDEYLPEEQESIEEGFETKPVDTTKENKTPIQKPYEQNKSKTNNEEKIGIVSNIEYTKGYMNPLLKQTNKRIISVDSQYRTLNVDPISTSFTFNLSEPIRDVLSISLYSVHIPYTWYTISKNYGSNFMYLKTDSPGITGGDYDYKIEVPYGNYSADTLVTALNTSISNLYSTYNDISFGSTEFTYNNVNGLISLKVDIMNLYNECNYSMDFSEIGVARKLGFIDTTYTVGCVISDLSNITSSFSPETSNLVKIDNSNNYFTIIQYDGTLWNNNTYDQDAIINKFIIYIQDELGVNLNGMYSYAQIFDYVNTSLSKNPNLINSNLTLNTLSYYDNVLNNQVVKKCFYLKIQLDRIYVYNNYNIKTRILFSQKDTLNAIPLWCDGLDLNQQKVDSFFKFKNTAPYNELSVINSENELYQSNYKINNRPYIKFDLVSSYYPDISFVAILDKSSETGYSLQEYIGNIQQSINTMNTNTQLNLPSDISNANPYGIFKNVNVTRDNSGVEFKFGINYIIPHNYFYIDISQPDTWFGEAVAFNDSYVTLNITSGGSKSILTQEPKVNISFQGGTITAYANKYSNLINTQTYISGNIDFTNLLVINGKVNIDSTIDTTIGATLNSAFLNCSGQQQITGILTVSAQSKYMNVKNINTGDNKDPIYGYENLEYNLTNTDSSSNYITGDNAKVSANISSYQFFLKSTDYTTDSTYYFMILKNTTDPAIFDMFHTLLLNPDVSGENIVLRPANALKINDFIIDGSFSISASALCIDSSNISFSIENDPVDTVDTYNFRGLQMVHIGPINHLPTSQTTITINITNPTTISVGFNSAKISSGILNFQTNMTIDIDKSNILTTFDNSINIITSNTASNVVVSNPTTSTNINDLSNINISTYYGRSSYNGKIYVKNQITNETNNIQIFNKSIDVSYVDISYNFDVSGYLYTNNNGKKRTETRYTNIVIEMGNYTIPNTPVNVKTVTKPYELDLSVKLNYTYERSIEDLNARNKYILCLGYKSISNNTVLNDKITNLKWIDNRGGAFSYITQYISYLKNSFIYNNTNNDASNVEMGVVDSDNTLLFTNITIAPPNIDEVSGSFTQNIDFLINKYFTSNNFNIEFIDPSASSIELNSWHTNLNLNQTYNLIDLRNVYYTIKSGNVDNYIDLSIDATNITKTPQIKFLPLPNISGLYADNNANDIVITLQNRNYTRNELFQEINNQFNTNPITKGSQIYSISTGTDYTRIFININKAYNATNYKAVFYDIYSFSACNNHIQNLQNVSWDDTLGWILGFRTQTIYDLSGEDATYDLNNKITSYKLPNIFASNIKGRLIQADTTYTNNLYNYFLIKLDDYTQSHLNDGLITISNSANLLNMPNYISNHNIVKNPLDNEEVFGVNQVGTNQLTQNQMYAAQQIVDAKQKLQKNQINYSKGPYVQDIFGFIPIKTSSISMGGTIIDSSGPLQNQQRIYFGPVNIRRMTITLLNDKGDVVDLNGSNWSFSFVCEQLYQQNTIK